MSAADVHFKRPEDHGNWCAQAGPSSRDTSKVTCEECTRQILADGAVLAELEY